MERITARRDFPDGIQKVARCTPMDSYFLQVTPKRFTTSSVSRPGPGTAPATPERPGRPPGTAAGKVMRATLHNYVGSNSTI